jgi:hypothetical protein
MSVFNDPSADTFPDELHSQDEDRLITIGLSSKQRLLFISHREDGDCIRLIGARKANAAEKRAYEDLHEERS